MSHEYIQVKKSQPLSGTVKLLGAKNAVLVIMASLLLTDGTSVLENVPSSSDVFMMIKLLEVLGAQVVFDQEKHVLTVNTSKVNNFAVPAEIMQKMRASVLVMGPLLAKFRAADVALPGGCSIGSRPIDYHLNNFINMGAQVEINDNCVQARVQKLQAQKIILDYPSVGATENIMMAAVLTEGKTTIVNAALEPEVLDLVFVLKKMGAEIQVLPAATIEITGVQKLQSIKHHIVFDRLEAGSLLLAAAVTGGSISLPQAPAQYMEIFLSKLEQMGHTVKIGKNGIGVELLATKTPKAVSFKTHPYPGFPTDLQAPMMVAQCLAEGLSIIEETVFENRLLHVEELKKMGANITVKGSKAFVTGVEQLQAADVRATDIRASCALALAGLFAEGTTKITGIHHWRRGYDNLEKKLSSLGANISVEKDVTNQNVSSEKKQQAVL